MSHSIQWFHKLRVMCYEWNLTIFELYNYQLNVTINSQIYTYEYIHILNLNSNLILKTNSDLSLANITNIWICIRLYYIYNTILLWFFYTSFSIHTQEFFFRNRKLKLIKYLYLGFEYDLYLIKSTEN